MKYSLDLRIISNDQATRDAILASLPSGDDSRVWAEGFDALTESKDDNGDAVLSGMIRFNESADRDTIENEVKDAQGMFSLCEPGSYLRLHICHHDEDPPKPCEVTTLYEVVES